MRSEAGSGRRALVGAAALVEALSRGAPVRRVVALEGPRSSAAERALALAAAHGAPLRRVSARELRRLSPEGADACELLALQGPDPDASLEEALAGEGAAWLLAGVAYPGNAGVAIRAAEVSGADLVAIDADFDRRDRRECLRASMRSDRWLPVHFETTAHVIAAARSAGRRIIAIESEGTAAPWETSLRGPLLFLVGGEQRGLSPALCAAADAVVRLPMQGFVPSYNLQSAAAMVMAERLRQEACTPSLEA